MPRQLLQGYPLLVAVAEGYVRLRSNRNPQHATASTECRTTQTQPRFTRQLLQGYPLCVAVAEGYVRLRSDRNLQHTTDSPEYPTIQTQPTGAWM